MENISVKERIQIVEFYFTSDKNITNTIRKINSNFPRHSRPSYNAVKNFIDKFLEIGCVQHKKTPIRLRPVRSVENIAAVSENVDQQPSTSIRRRSQQLDISRSSLHRILMRDLHLHAYKVQLTQELKPTDHSQRHTFTDWCLQKLNNADDFFKKVIFSDEAHFHLAGYVNKQNCRIWGSENPRIIEQQPMHAQRVTVWCGFWAGGVIGPYFFENDEGRAVSVNGNRYRSMITNFFWPELDGMDVDNMWFQQDGATCHTAEETMQLLQQQFPGRVISRKGDVNWPPRSCDLTPLDFFLWGYVKSKVYADNPRTIRKLQNNIISVIGEIERELCKNVMENFVKRINICKKSRGGHLEDILFHC